MNIGRDDLVLEIGSGHNPKPRSDVLCDMLPEDDTQRGGMIVRDRPFIAADGEYLPFADKSFDYIICCHVLEHAEDPALFLSELMRVGKAGYIEMPTEIGERLYGWPYHKWLINLDTSDRLILKKKTEDGAFGQLFHYLFSTDSDYAKFHTRNHRLFLIQYEWFGSIDYEIVEPDTVFMDLGSREAVERLIGERTKPGIAGLIKSLVPSGAIRWAKSTIVKGKGRHKRTLRDIESIIVCPVCKGQVQWHCKGDSEAYSHITCQTCDREYPIGNGIPFLLPKRND